MGSAVTVLVNGDLASGSDDYTIKIRNPIDWILNRTLNVQTPSVFALPT